MGREWKLPKWDNFDSYPQLQKEKAYSATVQNPQQNPPHESLKRVAGFKWKMGSEWTQVYYSTWSYKDDAESLKIIKSAAMSKYLNLAISPFPHKNSSTIIMQRRSNLQWDHLLQYYKCEVSKASSDNLVEQAHNFTSTSSFVVHQNLH